MNGDWVLTVEQLNEYVRKQLAGDPLLRAVRVRGELSGFKRHFSGHLYFSIKDERARVQCVMFRQSAQGLAFEPKDGQQVIVSGAASLYAQTGTYQLYCEHMQREGTGDLYLRFEALKEKLSREGLFDPARKKPLPLLPRRVGIVTSRSGAALRDMLKVIKRRDPRADILVCPAQVQGEAAIDDIVSALGAINRDGSCQVILLGRGGGSIEDLWAFNEEKVARAIAASAIPVVSGVGHETDFTIADFVADLRAATPSMAAELAVPVRAQLEEGLALRAARMRRAQLGRLALAGARLDQLGLRLGRPQALLGPHRERIASLKARLDAAVAARIARETSRLDQLARTLEALDPSQVLDRGYALVTAGGKVITGILGVAPGLGVDILMRGGTASATICTVKEEQVYGGQT